MLSDESLNIFAVVGKPISYSKTPQMMNAAFRLFNLNAVNLRMAAETPEDAVETIHRLGIVGCNVTAPFKNSILPLLSDVDTRSEQIKSVNTILRKGSQLIGYNTDVNGIFASIASRFAAPDDLFVLIIGTGGAARAAIYTAQKMKMNVFLCGRNFDKTRQLAAETGSIAIKPERISQAAATAALIITTIPADAELIEAVSFQPFHVVLDSIYPNHSLQQRVEASGATYISGNEWLLHQACPVFKIFTGEDAPFEVMQEALNQPQPIEHQYVTLVGTSINYLAEVAQHVAPLFRQQVINLDGFLLPMSVFQDLPEEDSKTLIICGLEQLADEPFRDFVQRQTFTIWVDEGSDWSDMERYNKTVEIFASVADILVPSYLKSVEETAALVAGELAII